MDSPDAPKQPSGPAGAAAQPPAPRGAMARFLAVVEWLGNLLPHPVTLFALFTAGVAVLSAIGAGLEWSVVDPRPEGASGRAPDGRIAVRSLLDADGLRWITTSLVSNFVGFVPLGTVLVALLGVGVAERSGLLAAGMRALVLAAPRQLVTPAVVLAGVLSNTASEMGYVVLVPLSAALFHAVGRHPLAGLAAAFAGVSGGYSANLFLGTIDPLLAGLTEAAARLVAPEYTVHAAVNWHFMKISVPMITLAGWFVTARIVEPRLGPYDPRGASEDLAESDPMRPLERRESRALAAALFVGALGLALVAYLSGLTFALEKLAFGSWRPFEPIVEFLRAAPGFGILGVPPGGELKDAAILRGVVAVIFALFLIPGVVYGRMTGTLKNDRDVIEAMATAMSSLGLYIVLVFFAAQFVACFDRSNLGALLAVLGSDLLVALRLDGPVVFLPFILMCCVVNLMLGSASAQWAVTAPIFVPMLMRVGYSPEVIQAAYRIGDSSTNIITPMMSYFGLILAFVARYDKRVGIGTIIGMMLPYSIVFLTGWVVLFYLWVFVLGLPVGPGAPTYYDPGG